MKYLRKFRLHKPLKTVVSFRPVLKTNNLVTSLFVLSTLSLPELAQSNILIKGRITNGKKATSRQCFSGCYRNEESSAGMNYLRCIVKHPSVIWAGRADDLNTVMETKNHSLSVSPEIGNVSAEFIIPDQAVCIMTLAHGAGAGMHHAFMVALAEALAEKNIGTLRFNFPFMENKKKRADFPAVAHKTIEKACEQARKDYTPLPLFLSGKSFGGRMSSQYLALNNGAAVEGIVFYGFPLHPAKKPSTERAEHLKQIDHPMLFLQGTKDQLAEWHLMEGVCSSLPKTKLVKLEGADHAFKKGKENLVPILAMQTREWIDAVL